MLWLGLSAEQIMEYVAFLSVAGLALVSGLGVMFAPRVLHAAVWLLFALLGVAGMFALLGAPVLFAVQLLVYAGAIAVMIIFAVVLLERGTGRRILGGNRHLFAGVVGAGGLVVVLMPALMAALAYGHLVQLPAPGHVGSAEEIGRLFLTRHLLAFELISVVLLVSMIGAIVLARPDRGGGAEEAAEEENAAAVPGEQGGEAEQAAVQGEEVGAR